MKNLKSFINLKSLILILILVGLLTVGLWAEGRPTRNYLVFYDNGLSQTVEADSVDDALLIFRQTTKHEIVHSVSRKSYVSAVWLRFE